jgi:hypothetical protein
MHRNACSYQKTALRHKRLSVQHTHPACRFDQISPARASVVYRRKVGSLPARASLESTGFQVADFKQKTAVSRALAPKAFGARVAQGFCLGFCLRTRGAWMHRDGCSCRNAALAQSSWQRAGGSARGKRCGRNGTLGRGGSQRVRRQNAYATLCADFH